MNAIATQLVTEARIRRQPNSDPHVIQVVPALAAGAVVPEGGRSVVLVVRDNTGLVYHFSIAHEVADKLRTDLKHAVREAKHQSSMSRN